MQAAFDKSKKGTEIIERKWLINLLYKPIENVKGIITRDMSAVKNAILNDYNNGLAEGSVNKLKLIKKIMYGRNSFKLLKSKLLRLEFKRKIN